MKENATKEKQADRTRGKENTKTSGRKRGEEEGGRMNGGCRADFAKRIPWKRNLNTDE